jgi:1-acyl-sn-glycerol-3-phosphate acyltransferase
MLKLIVVRMALLVCRYVMFIALSAIWLFCGYLGLWAVALAVKLRLCRGCDWMIHVCARGYLLLARVLLGIKLRVQGRVPEKHSVVACNHQSMADGIVLAATVPRPVVLFRASLLWGTGLPWLLSRLGMIAVRTKSILRRFAAYGKGWLGKVRRVARSRNICIFPEGTRVNPAQAMTSCYRRGVTVIARATQRSVYPAVIDSGRIWGRGLWPRMSACDKVLTIKFLARCRSKTKLHVIERNIKNALRRMTSSRTN